MSARRLPLSTGSGNHAWVSFSDILLTLVCAVLYLRMIQHSGSDQEHDRARFETRLAADVQNAGRLHAQTGELRAAFRRLQTLVQQRDDRTSGPGATP